MSIGLCVNANRVHFPFYFMCMSSWVDPVSEGGWRKWIPQNSTGKYFANVSKRSTSDSLNFFSLDTEDTNKAISYICKKSVSCGSSVKSCIGFFPPRLHLGGQHLLQYTKCGCQFEKTSSDSIISGRELQTPAFPSFLYGLI